MMVGFKTTGVDTFGYRIGAQKPGEGTWNIPSFDCSADKSVGEIHHSQIAGRLSEIVAARGSCDNKEVKA